VYDDCRRLHFLGVIAFVVGSYIGIGIDSYRTVMHTGSLWSGGVAIGLAGFWIVYSSILDSEKPSWWCSQETWDRVSGKSSRTVNFRRATFSILVELAALTAAALAGILY
jgi:hypothetical protein